MIVSMGLFLGAPSWSSDWTRDALRLTGESDSIRNEAIKNLKKEPHLAALLRRQLRGPHRFLALDVIAALKLQALLPDLLRLSESDPSGLSYLAINALMTTASRQQIIAIYRDRLLNPRPPQGEGPSQVLLLDSLALLGEPLPLEKLRTLLITSRWPEVQGAALNYARVAILQDHRFRYIDLIQDARLAKAFQVREQAVILAKELPPRLRKKTPTLIRTGNIGEFPLQTLAGVLDIRVAFGYKDARPARLVADRYERLYLLEKLLSPCSFSKNSTANYACGFQRNLEDSNLLEKTVVLWTAPLPLRIQLRITPSSAGPDDDDNRINPYQTLVSKISEMNFINGLQNADVVLYVGHSRDGGGPSFFPPVLTRQKLVAYAWYKKKKPGLKQMVNILAHLQNTKRAPLKLGLISCTSTKHFEKNIRQANPKVETANTSHLLYYAEALEKTLQLISDSIQKRSNDYALKNSPPAKPFFSVAR
jgi:hypothetical protein